MASNKVWLITGAGRGMGVDIAKPRLRPLPAPTSAQIKDAQPKPGKVLSQVWLSTSSNVLLLFWVPLLRKDQSWSLRNRSGCESERCSTRSGGKACSAK